MKIFSKIRFVLLLCLAISCAQGNETAPLRVALYPYVPDVSAFSTALTNAWAAANRSEPIEFISWDCYNEPFPTNAHVVVADCEFLEAYVAEGRIRPLDTPPLSSKIAAKAEDFFDFAIDGCRALDSQHNLRLYGLPQMLCTYYVFGRPGIPLPAGCDFAPLPDSISKPIPGKGLLFYATGDDMTKGIVRLYLDRTMGDEKRGAAAFATIVAAAGNEQLAFYPEDGDAFIRANFFRDGLGANYIDYSEGLSRLAPDGNCPYPFRRLTEYNTPYFVDPILITADCPEDKLDAAAACLDILSSREFLSSVLFPANGAPSYILPGRKDTFEDFAGRNPAYAAFLRDTQMPGNRTWRLPADAVRIILDAAARTK